jgi:hypothetical protein
MRTSAKVVDPPLRRLRHLAWFIALVLAVCAWYQDPSWPLRIAAAAVFAVGTVLPKTFRPLYRACRWLLRGMVDVALRAFSSRRSNPVESHQARPENNK